MKHVHPSKMIIALIYTYFAYLGGWTILRFVFADRWWWLFLLNSFALYAFLPLILIIPMAIFAKKRTIWIGVTASLLLGISLYGDLFIPHPSQPAQTEQATTLRVMTYNLLWINANADGVIASLKESDADVIALQELNHTIAGAIQQELITTYPYQDMRPDQSPGGAGVISRYPMRRADIDIPGSAWDYRPHFPEIIDVHGNEVLFFGFHASPPSLLHHSAQMREAQAQALVELAQAYQGAFVAAGDFNATDMSKAYKIVTKSLHEAWREVGWGPGHTFPGSEGGADYRVSGVSVPKWLVRIDHVFYSNHWQALSADLGTWDGQSDHRPVVVLLQLNEQ